MATERVNQKTEWSNHRLSMVKRIATYQFCAPFLITFFLQYRFQRTGRTSVVITWRRRINAVTTNHEDVENGDPCTALSTDHNGVRQSRRPVQQCSRISTASVRVRNPFANVYNTVVNTFMKRRKPVWKRRCTLVLLCTCVM